MTHMSQEGLLDQAARIKREREAKEARVLNVLKLQRAVLVTLTIAAGAAAVVFGMRDSAHAKNTATLESAVNAKAEELKIAEAKVEDAAAKGRAKLSMLTSKVEEDRAAAKGWSEDAKVGATLRRLSEESENIDLAVSDLTTIKNDSIRNANWAAYKATCVKAVARIIAAGYTAIQIAGFIMNDAEKVGPIKLCNE